MPTAAGVGQQPHAGCGTGPSGAVGRLLQQSQLHRQRQEGSRTELNAYSAQDGGQETQQQDQLSTPDALQSFEQSERHRQQQAAVAQHSVPPWPLPITAALEAVAAAAAAVEQPGVLELLAGESTNSPAVAALAARADAFPGDPNQGPQPHAQAVVGSPSPVPGSFRIPTLPSGRVLQLCITETWGDHHYVGLCGLELFDPEGQPLDLRTPAALVAAEPHSINVLPDYGSDPRTPDKLLDGERRLGVVGRA